ncbi:MAG: hypothetical protein C0603_01155 [Denitrovibrio sp.]|nr:MAG: hypothetical protein C0603_01155 [Denitrovibrio sp.]
MELKIVDANTIEILGNIKSLDDYNDIKISTQKLIKDGCIHMTIDIKESLSMVSSVIGYLIKMINMDKVDLHINVWDSRLYNLLDQLNLVHTFNVSIKK